MQRCFFTKRNENINFRQSLKRDIGLAIYAYNLRKIGAELVFQSQAELLKQYQQKVAA